MKDFEQQIDYRFNDQLLMLEALTHSSYANEYRNKGIKCNERLEFLGDAVLSIVVADYIFENCPELPEGEMTKLRSSLVCEKALYNFAKQINLGDYLFLSKGEKNGGGADRASILSDAFEAVIAAIYLDGGIESARKHILRFIVPEIKNKNKKPFKDYKTLLQEIIQQNHGERLSYEVVGEEGPDHDKMFWVQVLLNSNVIGHGEGKSKKQSDEVAAKEALRLMGYKYR